MNSFGGGLLLGVLGGLVGGAVVAHVAFRSSPAANVMADADVQDPSGEAAAASMSPDELRLAHTKLRQQLTDAERRERQAADNLSESKRIKDAEIAALRADVKRLTPTPGGTPTGVGEHGVSPVQPTAIAKDSGLSVEEAKRRGETLKADVERAVAAKDKDAAIAAVKELKKLGMPAIKSYIAAYALMQAHGNPWAGNNDLGLSHGEHSSLMDKEQMDYALADPDGDVPVGVRISAIYTLTYGRDERPPEARAAIFGSMLERGPAQELAAALIENLGQVNHPSAVPFLSSAANNTGLDSALRVDAVETMARFQNNADWDLIRTLTGDADPKVQEAANRAMLIREPPVTGYYINWIGEENQAALAGMKPGDILMSYNKSPITDVKSLNKAKEGAKGSVPIEVWRNGTILTLTIAPGQIGINGFPVQKKG